MTPKFLSEKYTFLKSQLSLDLLNLDEELSRISILVQDAAECTAQANEIRDAAKECLSQTYSMVSAVLRTQKNEAGKPKAENQIESEVPLDERHQKALAELGDARVDAGLWASMVEGLRTKSSAMRVTADLVSSGYLTMPYVLDKRRSEIRSASPKFPQR